MSLNNVYKHQLTVYPTQGGLVCKMFNTMLKPPSRVGLGWGSKKKRKSVVFSLGGGGCSCLAYRGKTRGLAVLPTCCPCRCSCLSGAQWLHFCFGLTISEATECPRQEPYPSAHALGCHNGPCMDPAWQHWLNWGMNDASGKEQVEEGLVQVAGD